MLPFDSRRCWLLLAATLIPCFPAHGGALEDDLALCLGQPSWLTRVQCYDKATRAHGIEPARTRQPPSPTDEAVADQSTETASLTPTSPANGKWRVETAPGAQPEILNVWLMLTSDTLATNHANEQTGADLVLRCMDQSLDVMVWAGGSHFGSPQSVTTRIGPDQYVTLDWGTSSDGEWAFHPAPRPFIDALSIASQLTLTMTPVDAPVGTYDFDLSGLADIAEQLDVSCPRP